MVIGADKVQVLISSMPFFSRFAIAPRWREPYGRSRHPVCNNRDEAGKQLADCQVQVAEANEQSFQVSSEKGQGDLPVVAGVKSVQNDKAVVFSRGNWLNTFDLSGRVLSHRSFKSFFRIATSTTGPRPIPTLDTKRRLSTDQQAVIMH